MGGEFHVMSYYSAILIGAPHLLIILLKLFNLISSTFEVFFFICIHKGLSVRLFSCHVSGFSITVHACVLSCFSRVRLCDFMDCSPPGSSVLGVLQATILERVAAPSSRGSSWPRDWTQVSYISCTGRQILYHKCHLGSPWCWVV